LGIRLSYVSKDKANFLVLASMLSWDPYSMAPRRDY